jgi:transcriptional regulator with XRE-family HTH domain
VAEKMRKHLLLREDVWGRIMRGNVSQNDFARKAGISSGYLSQLLSRVRSPGPAVRRVLQDALPGADFDELFEEVAGDPRPTGSRP